MLGFIGGRRSSYVAHAVFAGHVAPGSVVTLEVEPGSAGMVTRIGEPAGGGTDWRAVTAMSAEVAIEAVSEVVTTPMSRPGEVVAPVWTMTGMFPVLVPTGTVKSTVGPRAMLPGATPVTTMS